MSNKHKHYEMIVAKAANFDLIQFIKLGDKWEIVGGHDNHVVNFGDHYQYFLCLPRHNENGQCLHWLDGGEVEVSDDGERWEEYNLSVEHPKYPMTDFTGYEFQFRIKPKKEKRWIAFGSESGNVYGTYLSEKKCKMAWPSLQIFEIEVEV